MFKLINGDLADDIFRIIEKVMKNPFLRAVLIISLVLSCLSILILISESFLTTKTIQNFDLIVSGNGVATVKSTSNMDWVLASLRIIELAILFPMPLISFALGGDEGAMLFAGMMLESIGPVVTFVAWFIILYFITYLYARSKRKENYSLNQKSIKALFIFCILCVALFTVGQNLYFNNMSKKTFNKLIGFPITLSSVSPDLAKEGDLITLTGSGFSKQEIYVWLVDKGQKNEYGAYRYGILWMGTPPNDSLVQFPLKFPLCNNAAQFLQNNCQKWENFSPGRYIIEIRGGSLPDPSLSFEVLASNDVTQLINQQSIAQPTGEVVNWITYHNLSFQSHHLSHLQKH